MKWKKIPQFGVQIKTESALAAVSKHKNNIVATALLEIFRRKTFLLKMISIEVLVVVRTERSKYKFGVPLVKSPHATAVFRLSASASRNTTF